MSTKFVVIRDDTEQEHRFYPALKHNDDLYRYTLGFRDQDTAMAVADELKRQLTKHIDWWLRDHAFAYDSVKPLFVIEL
jgi:hypothetical protein